MRPDRRRRRLITSCLVAALGAAVGLLAWTTGATDRPERAAVDARFALRGTGEPPPSVVVVGVDDATLADTGARWPFSRAVQARAIRAIAAADPRVIAYDVQLSELSDDADADQALALALVDAEGMVLATTEYEPDLGPNVFLPDEVLTQEGILVGNAAFPETPDGVFRRVPYEVDGLRSFAVAAAGAAMDREVSREGFDEDGAIIDYAGPAGTVRTISYGDVLAGRVAAESLRDRVVVVGTTAPRLGDAHATPIGDAPMSGPEINANAIATILDGVPLRDAPAWQDVLAILALAGAGAAAGLWLRPWLAGVAIGLVAVGYAAIAQGAFAGGTVIALIDPLLALATAGLAGLAVTFALLERERTRLRAEFARFVPPAVVGQVIEQAGDDQRLGGRRVYATVMFADLRGFTAVAERLSPEGVIEMLNGYLTEMSDAILDHGGTLVSYMGDGIMAIFGAPIEQPDHADRAVRAAREMLGVRLARFNARVAERLPGQEFTMGIGLASGPVMSGNVGSERRLEYAAVGDTTNMASRLQGLTKETPHPILIADATRAALSGQVPDLAAVGALDVRGRQVPAAVWTLAPAADDPPEG